MSLSSVRRLHTVAERNRGDITPGVANGAAGAVGTGQEPAAADLPFTRFRRRTAETVVGLAVQTGAGAAYVVTVARFLGPHGTGVLAVLVLASTIVSFLVSEAFVLANVYFGARDETARGALLANSTLVAFVGGSLLAG